jgi:hypothetical protein
MMVESVQWLIVEGLIALFGAGLLYLALGVCWRIVGNRGPFAWREAADAMGWLYGSMMIAIQSSVSFLRHSGTLALCLGYACVLSAVACCLLLVVGMLQRGAVPSWKPPPALRWSAFLLAGGILLLAFYAHRR